MTDAYPLAWPEGWPRTPTNQRRDGRNVFGKVGRAGSDSWSSKRALTFTEARDGLLAAVRKVGGRGLIVSTNFQLNMSGLPRGDRRRPDDQGVAIYFERGGSQLVMARDAFERAEENMRSLGLALEAMAQLERHGGTGLAGRAFRGFAALSAPKKPHQVLGIAADASEAEIKAAWRKAIAGAHPDQGGSQADAASVNAARDAMLKGPPK